MGWSMFCPRCGASQQEELKFCKVCGANLYAVRQAVDTKDTGESSTHRKPWYAEMTLSDAESRRRKEELDHQRGIDAEIKRHNEIKAGVITGGVGLALAIVIHIFMNGLILSGNVSSNTAQILSRLWIAGVIPMFVGLALIINGVVVSKRLAEITRRAAQSELPAAEIESDPLILAAGQTTEFVPANLSVTEDTTRHLTHRG